MKIIIKLMYDDKDKAFEIEFSFDTDNRALIFDESRKIG